MGGTPLRREYRDAVLAFRGPGGGERSKRGGTKVGSRVNLRLRLPWTEARRRTEERAAAVGSAFKALFFFLLGCSPGSRQMLGSRFVSGLYEDGMLTQAASRVKLSLMDARAWSGWLCCLPR